MIDQNTVEHLKLIQQVVERMGRNSFQLKAWTVVLVAAILAYAGTQIDYRYYLLGLMPTLAFWGLDGYYLWQERYFRALYDAIRRGQHDLNLYGLFSMNTKPYGSQVPSWSRVCVSRTVIGFYFPIAAVISITCIVAYASGGTDTVTTGDAIPK